MTHGGKRSLDPLEVQLAAHEVERPEEQPRPIGQDLGQPRAPLPQQRQIQEEVERLFNERLREFRRDKVADETLRWDMTNISR